MLLFSSTNGPLLLQRTGLLNRFERCKKRKSPPNTCVTLTPLGGFVIL